MGPIDFKNLCQQGESDQLEFKTSFQKEVIESLVAFANTRGGTVWVGITDQGALKGVTLGKETLNEWLGQIKSATSPALIPELTAHTIDGKTVVAIEKYGSGFIRIRQALQDYPEIAFSIEEFAGGVMASFIQSQPESQLPLEARILRALARAPMGKREISEALGQKEVSGQLNKVMRALLATAKIELTLPHKPTSRLQQYRLTELGHKAMLK